MILRALFLIYFESCRGGNGVGSAGYGGTRWTTHGGAPRMFFFQPCFITALACMSNLGSCIIERKFPRKLHHIQIIGEIGSSQLY